MATLAPAQTTRRDDEGSGEGLIAAGLLLALGGFLAFEARKHPHGSTSRLPSGLYTDCADPTIPNTCTIWYVPPMFPDGTGNVRYGVASPTQLARCFPGMPVQSQATLMSLGGFGNADDPNCSYIPTVGAVSACVACPPGATGS